MWRLPLFTRIPSIASLRGAASIAGLRAPSSLRGAPSSSIAASLHTSSPAAHMDLRAVVEVLERLAPTQAAEPWDNVGLLVAPTPPCIVKRLLITNDLTEQVLEEALCSSGEKLGLVVSYHPPIFKPLKALTQGSATERVIVRALEEGVAVYSPHTSLDDMEGGINEWLLSAVGEGEVSALGLRKHAAPCSNCLQLRGTDNWQLLEREVLSQQAGVGEIHTSTSGAVVECSDGALATLLPMLAKRRPTLSISVTTNPKVVPTLCGGKLLTLTRPLPLSAIVSRVKEKLQLKHIRLARPFGVGEDPVIKTAAACAGSGGGVLQGGMADLLLTGEMSHHQVLAAVGRGSAVILCEHTNTERGFLQGAYKERLEQALDVSVQVSTARTDRDPLEIV